MRFLRQRLDLEPIIAGFVAEQQELIALEREAEVRETIHLQSTLTSKALERRGLRISRLKVIDETTGLGGRDIVELGSTDGAPIDVGRFGSGDIVAIRAGGEKSSAARTLRAAPTAVIHRISPARIVLMLDRDLPLPDDPIRLERVANEVTYSRLHDAMAQLARYKGGPADRLRTVLFGAQEPEFESIDVAALEFSSALDASQKDAVAFAVGARDVALIHGPPGTGKTTTLAEVVVQSVRRCERVLACAGSNIAVDNMVEHLVDAGLRVVRIGHPARLLPSVIEHSLDSLVARSELNRAAREVRGELDAAHKRIRGARDRQERYAVRDEIRALRRELRDLERQTIDSVIQGADVVLATNVGAADPLIAGGDFHLVVIDEAAQAVEASAWIPIMKGRRVVLAGDHQQLPPTIISRKAERAGLAVTLFERLMRERGETISRLLETQYRMHETIMSWSSRELYAGRIRADESVRAHLLDQLDGCQSDRNTSVPLVMIDTAGCGFDEEEDDDGTSRSNPGEAKIVSEHVAQLVASGVHPSRIAIISPYRSQVRRLRSELGAVHPGLEIDSVDGFQGREKEAIVLSTVRSNARGEIGFLSDHRRMNVAITRARRHVALIGDSATISNDEFLARMVAYFQENGDYRSAWESA